MRGAPNRSRSATTTPRDAGPPCVRLSSVVESSGRWRRPLFGCVTAYVGVCRSVASTGRPLVGEPLASRLPSFGNERRPSFADHRPTRRGSTTACLKPGIAGRRQTAAAALVNGSRFQVRACTANPLTLMGVRCGAPRQCGLRRHGRCRRETVLDRAVLPHVRWERDLMNAIGRAAPKAAWRQGVSRDLQALHA